MIWKCKGRGRLAEGEANGDYKERVLNSNMMTMQQHLTICAAQVSFSTCVTDSVLFISPDKELQILNFNSLTSTRLSSALILPSPDDMELGIQFLNEKMVKVYLLSEY